MPSSRAGRGPAAGRDVDIPRTGRRRRREISGRSRRCRREVESRRRYASPKSLAIRAPKGAIVRASLGLDSAQVGILKTGTTCVAVEEALNPADGKTSRCRLAAPLRGWISLKTATPLRANDAEFGETQKARKKEKSKARHTWEENPNPYNGARGASASNPRVVAEFDAPPVTKRKVSTSRAEILFATAVDADFARRFKRTTPAVQRRKNQPRDGLRLAESSVAPAGRRRRARESRGRGRPLRRPGRRQGDAEEKGRGAGHRRVARAARRPSGNPKTRRDERPFFRQFSRRRRTGDVLLERT